jgi:hypothetical protein
MRKASTIILTWIPLLIILLLPNKQACAEQYYTAKEFQRVKNQLIGKTVIIEGKYKEYWGASSPYISLVSVLELKFYLPRSGKLLSNSKSKLDINGTKLLNRVSNVLLTVRVKATSTAPLLELLSIVKIADDIERFEKRLKVVIDKDPNDARGRFSVASEAREWAHRYKNKKLTDWSLLQDRDTLKKREAMLKPSEIKAWIRLADQYIGKLDDKANAIAILDRVFNDSKNNETRQILTKKLKTLGAYYYKGNWMLYHQFKHLEGYIKRVKDGRSNWIRKERAEFEDAIALDSKRKFPFIIKADPVYLADAKQGKVTRGMRTFQVVHLKVNNKAIGFPDHLDRTRLAIRGNLRVYDQWTYKSGLRFYYVDGHLFRWFNEKIPYPEK